MYSSAILPDKCRCGQLIAFMFQSASLVFGGFCGVNVFRSGILGFDVMGYRPSLGHDFCLLASGEIQDLGANLLPDRQSSPATMASSKAGAQWLTNNASA